jgi:hypothetical protein
MKLRLVSRSELRSDGMVSAPSNEIRSNIILGFDRRQLTRATLIRISFMMTPEFTPLIGT